MPTKKSVAIGCVARNKVSKLTGVVTAYTEMLSGTRQFAIQPAGKGESEPEGHFIDIEQVEYVKEGPVKATPPDFDHRARLGDQVRDAVTAVKGIVTSITLHLNGCTLLGLQQPKDERGKVPAALYIDWKRCEVTRAQVVDSPFTVEEPKIPRGREPTRRKPTGGPGSPMSSRRVV